MLSDADHTHLHHGRVALPSAQKVVAPASGSVFTSSGRPAAGICACCHNAKQEPETVAGPTYEIDLAGLRASMLNCLSLCQLADVRQQHGKARLDTAASSSSMVLFDARTWSCHSQPGCNRKALIDSILTTLTALHWKCKVPLSYNISGHSFL